ncbi:hypothetical protein ACET3Z_000458 [Daucus carota]
MEFRPSSVLEIISEDIGGRVVDVTELVKVRRKKLMEMPKNQVIGITVGDFQPREVFGSSEIKFSMVQVDDCWKHGLVIMGVLLVPKL